MPLSVHAESHTAWQPEDQTSRVLAGTNADADVDDGAVDIDAAELAVVTTLDCYSS